MKQKLLILLGCALFGLSACVFQTALTKPESSYSREAQNRRAEIDSLRVELSRSEVREYKSMLIQLYSEPTIKAAIDSVYPFNKLSEIKP